MSQTHQDPQQYKSSGNLRARANLLARYSNMNWFGWVFDRLALGTGSRVLDIGCGPAWFWRRVADRCPADVSLMLADSSPGMVQEAETRMAETSVTVTTQVADAVNLPFPDGAFDAVVMMHMLYHVSDPETAIAEAYRVLRPGGRVYVTTNTRDNMAAVNTLGARAFGGDGNDLAAMRVSLDDAARLVMARFDMADRADLAAEFTCDDPQAIVDFLLSMPPGDRAPEAERATLRTIVDDAMQACGGALAIRRKTGMVTGTKA